MTNRQAVFRKSSKGVQVVATRQAGMAHRLRSALIMVDGKRGFEELARVVSVLGDPEPLLAELEAADLIEMVPVDAVAAAEVPSFSAVGAGAPATLAGAQRFASRLLIELLGPTSEALCLKIETAPDMPAFITAVKRARDVVREVKGQAAVARFIEQVEVHTPSA